MKVGRNDPCPCGSGKKYKKCCLEKDLAEVKLATPDELVRFFEADENCVVCGEPVTVFGSSGIGDEETEPDGAIVTVAGQKRACHIRCFEQVKPLIEGH